jgi:thiamine pyrophosphate-dependent acetolactate synthase large subunit-like protein
MTFSLAEITSTAPNAEIVIEQLIAKNVEVIVALPGGNFGSMQEPLHEQLLS